MVLRERERKKAINRPRTLNIIIFNGCVGIDTIIDEKFPMCAMVNGKISLMLYSFFMPM